MVGVLGLITSFSLVHGLLTGPTLLASPLYVACQKNVPALLNWTPFEGGTVAFETVTVPASASLLVQALSLNKIGRASCRAMVVGPLSVAVSMTVTPILQVVSDNVVLMVGVLGLITSLSLVHALLTGPTLLASPLYVACQKNVPALLNWTPFEPGTTPLVTLTVPASATLLVQALSLN